MRMFPIFLVFWGGPNIANSPNFYTTQRQAIQVNNSAISIFDQMIKYIAPIKSGPKKFIQFKIELVGKTKSSDKYSYRVDKEVDGTGSRIFGDTDSNSGGSKQYNKKGITAANKNLS